MLNELEKGRWAINFDLDTKLAEKYHPSGTRQGAYAELLKFFERHNFEHRQYSGYVSKNEITFEDIKTLTFKLVMHYPHIKAYMRLMDATLIKPEYIYDCTSLFFDTNKRVLEVEPLEKNLIEQDDEWSRGI